MKQLTILFLLKDDQILLAMKKRGFGEGRYNGVGGKVEAGETLEQAVVRECQEEIGVTPIDFSKVAEIIFDEQHKGVKERLQVHVYTSKSWDGEPIETEEMAPKWFKTSKIPYDQMWADDPYWLPQVLDGKLLKCEFHLDENDKVFQQSVQIINKF